MICPKKYSTLDSRVSVILINLDRAKNRLLKMNHQFASMGISYKRFSALDGKSYKYDANEYDEKLFKLCLGRKTNPNEVCCFLSHYKAIEHFLATNKEYLIIFEDDAIINHDFIDIINDLVGESSYWDFVKFNTSRDTGALNINVKNLINEYRLVASFFPKSLAASYIINRKAAESLKKGLLPMFVPYDHEMIKFWKYNIRQFSVFPSPVTVSWEDSFISDGRYYNKDNKFPFYKRISVLCYRVYTQLMRSINFYKLLRRS